MSRPPIAVYNGSGRVRDLLGFRRVVLRPELYSEDELAGLAAGGTQPLARLALSRDPGPPAPWRRTLVDPLRGTALVHLDQPGWQAHVRRVAEQSLGAGFAGLFLADLDVGWTHPDDVPHLVGLITALRELAGPAYLLANRGFGMLPRLAELVDGVLFESFSSRWADGCYALWPPDVLDVHEETAEDLLGYDLNLYALDYAADAALADVAERRARRFGMTTFVSDRTLSRLPSSMAGASHAE
jgi:hypothetical protein